jgi:hypothetical protein
MKGCNSMSRFRTFGAIRAKIAEMAMPAHMPAKAHVYRAAKGIEDRIKAREAAKVHRHQEAELKGVEEFAIECFDFKGRRIGRHSELCRRRHPGSWRHGLFGGHANGKCVARCENFTGFMKEQTKLTVCFASGMLVKKAMKGHVDLLGPATKVGEELMGIPNFDIPDYSELFSEEKELIGKLKKGVLDGRRQPPCKNTVPILTRISNY